jgi:hypothetical protein
MIPASMPTRPAIGASYIDWIVEARREETRARRIAQAVEWLGEGKRRNWKYERCRIG